MTFISCEPKHQDYKLLCQLIDESGLIVDDVMTYGLTPLDRLAEYWARAHRHGWSRAYSQEDMKACHQVIIISSKPEKNEHYKQARELGLKIRAVCPKTFEIIYSHK